MKKVILLSLSILLICLAYAFAEVPCKINYQGRLIKDNVPVDGTKTMRFSIYDSAVGPTQLWTSGDVNVEVHNGLFRYVLDLSSIDWAAGQTLYLEVQVETDILTPREELYAYPYAINSHLLEGATKEYFLNTSVETQKKDGGLNIMGNVGIGTNDPKEYLHLHNSGSVSYMLITNGWIGHTQTDGLRIGTTAYGNGLIWLYENAPLRFATNSQERVRITEAGNVGIGTTSPGAKLHIAGAGNGIMFPDGSLQTTANPKGWVYCNSAGTIQASYNVSSVTKNGKGDYTVNWNTGFSSANYAVAVTPVGTSGRYSAGVHTLTAGSARIRTFETYNGWNEDHDFHVVAFGAQ